MPAWRWRVPLAWRRGAAAGGLARHGRMEFPRAARRCADRRAPLRAHGRGRRAPAEQRGRVRGQAAGRHWSTRYRHSAVEHWRGDCLRRLDADTNDGGDRSARCAPSSEEIGGRRPRAGGRHAARAQRAAGLRDELRPPPTTGTPRCARSGGCSMRRPGKLEPVRIAALDEGPRRGARPRRGGPALARQRTPSSRSTSGTPWPTANG